MYDRMEVHNMYRVAIEKLDRWKESKRRKPLIIEGDKAGWQDLDDERIRKKCIC